MSEKKHGLSQYRLNYAKNHAQNFLETVNKIEMMFQLSLNSMVDEESAENYISANINELFENMEYFKDYIKQRKDMR